MRHGFFLLYALAACADHGEPPLPDAAVIVGSGFDVDKTSLDFGARHCGNTQDAQLVLRNKHDFPITIDLQSSLRDIVVPQHVDLAPRGTATLQVRGTYRTRARQTGTLKLSIAGGAALTIPTAIAGDPTDAQVVFSPTTVDFGQVLPSSIKDLTVKATSDSSARVTMMLGDTSTPRFVLVGAASALVSTVDMPSFTIRLTAGATPIEYTGTIPVTLPLGFCAPPVLDLRATVVP